MGKFLFLLLLLGAALAFARYQRRSAEGPPRPPWRFKPWPPDDIEPVNEVPVASLIGQDQAESLASVLRGSGIPVQIRNDRFPAGSSAAPFRLYVGADDAAAAREILDS